MIKVSIKNNIITITGHADFDVSGKDIVCSAASSIVITSVNLALRFDRTSVKYQENKDKLIIEIVKSDDITTKIMENMIMMLEELASTYKKNIKIIKEDIK